MNEALSFLRSLKEDGIEHVCLENTKLLTSAKQKPDDMPISQDAQREKMLELYQRVMKCAQCPVLVKNRTKIVFGAGNIRSKLVFVGEAPGRDEDQQGLPFVGRAGQLLTKIIEAMGMTRQDVFICNVLKCRPPENRAPAPDEVVNCRPFLREQLKLINPKIVVALGNHACQALLNTDKGISQLRGSFQDYEGLPVMCTYHPAYLLRNPAEKKKVWEDMKKVVQFLATAS